MKSKNYNMIKNYYECGLWNFNRIRNLVNKPLGITEEEYLEITEDTYQKIL